MFTQNTDPDPDKPLILQAVELLVAGPDDIRQRVEAARADTLASPQHRDKNAEDLRLATADALIERYAAICGRVGAITSAAGAIPGVGTVVALIGASAADLAISMKYQIELVHALALLFGRDITLEEEQRLCYTIAGLGVATQAGLLAAERFTVASILEGAQRLARTRLKRLLIDLFKKIGLRLTQRGLLRAIPLGVGAAFSYTSNKKLTRYIGRRARDFFLANPPATP
jgi:hypothetical protein